MHYPSRFFLAILAFGLLFFYVVPVAADTTTVTVTIERVFVWSGNTDASGIDAADLYPVVTIDGVVQGGNGFTVSNNNDVEESGYWSFPQEVDDTATSIPITVQIWDSDEGDSTIDSQSGDDHIDLDPGLGVDVNLLLNLATCSISGDTSGICYEVIDMRGDGVPGAHIWLRVTTDEVPAKATVAVEIDHISGFGEWDGPCTFIVCDAPDFYPVIVINRHEFDLREETFSNQFEGFPDDWAASDEVPLALGTIPVSINIWDADDLGNRGSVDVSPVGSRLDLTVNLDPCSVTGDAAGGCGVTITTSGSGTDCAGGTSPNCAIISFRITVDVSPPASLPDRIIRCLHEPIWPQIGEPVTITAEVLNASMNPVPSPGGITMEIWVNDTSAPVSMHVNANTHSFTFTPGPSDTQFVYGCQATGVEGIVWSGWHTTQIGTTGLTRAIPVIFVDSPGNVIDIVFVPEVDSYTSAVAPTFLDDVHNMLLTSFYGDRLFLRNQRMFNFWIAPDMANYWATCFIDGPGNWDSDYAFAEAGALLHREGIRDCSNPFVGLFSADVSSGGRVILHESGHKVFGLSDEYFSQFTVYFENSHLPNVYHAEFNDMDCENQASSVGNTGCHSWFGLGLGGFEWETSDPASNDLMAFNGRVNGLDRRRICSVLGSFGAINPCENE